MSIVSQGDPAKTSSLAADDVGRLDWTFLLPHVIHLYIVESRTNPEMLFDADGGPPSGSIHWKIIEHWHRGKERGSEPWQRYLAKYLEASKYFHLGAPLIYIAATEKVYEIDVQHSIIRTLKGETGDKSFDSFDRFAVDSSDIPVERPGGHYPRNERERIISWLSPLKFWQKQNDVLSDAHPGTGQWFLESAQFERWLDTGSKNLWCYGAPGSGKTVLTSIVVDHLRQQLSANVRVGVAVVYCAWNQQQILSPVNLLASIWSQLVVDKPLANEVKDLYHEQAGFGRMARYHQVFSILKNEIERFDSVYIVIDAFDELAQDNDSVDIFIEALSTMTSAPSHKVRVLATARYGQSLLSNANVIQIVAKGEDIRRFLEHHFQQGISTSRKLSDQARDDKVLRRSLVNTISRQADGLFLLARLYVDTLKIKPDMRALCDAVHKLPLFFDEQYDETWKRIEEQNPDYRTLARRILSWLSHSARPLQVQELRHALATMTGEKNLDVERLVAEDILLPCCHGLVAIDEKTQIIRLVHLSAQEYLGEHRSSLFPDAQAEMLSTCLSYLSFDHFRRGRCTSESFQTHDVNEVANGKRIAKWRFLPHRLSRFPFFQYAASNWGRHAAGQVEVSHRNQILAFLRDPMLLESAAQAYSSDLLDSPRSDTAAKDNRKNLPFLVAGSFGLDRTMTILIDGMDDFDVNTEYGSNKTLMLHQAVESGYMGLTGVLLGAGADPRLLGGAEHSVLYKAIAREQTEIVKMLLQYGDDNFIWPCEIYCATYRESITVIQYMVAHLDGTEKSGERLHQFLFHAACLGRTSVLEYVIQMGADLEARDGNGQTALCLAIKYGRPAAVGLLLDSKASTTVRDAAGRSLLRMSVSSHEVIKERFRFIQDYGREYAGIPETAGGPCSRESPMVKENWFIEGLTVWFEDCEDCDGMTLKDDRFREFLYQDEDHAEVLEKLLRHGGDVNEQDPEGITLLHSVAKSTSERARVFLEGSKGSLNMDPVDRDGRTPLHYAAAMGRAETVELLLEYGANIAARDNYGASTLHFGIMSFECTQLTIERGDLLDSQDLLHRTPLHYALMVEVPDQEVKELLSGAGASSEILDVFGKSAIDYMDVDKRGDWEHLETTEWIEFDMFYNGCSEMSIGKLSLAIENSAWHSARIGESWVKRITMYNQTTAEKQKRWSIVSDSAEEDFKPSVD
ncbi:MAG: hypothetical protein Q9168_002842 [Polycauliona sp. 1 TL-2023]